MISTSIELQATNSTQVSPPSPPLEENIMTSNAPAVVNLAANPPAPWTTKQKMFTTLSFALTFLFGLTLFIINDKDVSSLYRPVHGVHSYVVYTIAICLIILITVVLCYLAQKFHPTLTPTVWDGLSTHSVPYQLWLGIWAFILISTWCERISHEIFIDTTHCSRMITPYTHRPTFKHVALKRLRRPTFINYTRVAECDFGPLPPSPAPPSLDVNQKSGGGGQPSENTDQGAAPHVCAACIDVDTYWYDISESQKMINWNEFVLDSVGIIVYAMHTVFVAVSIIAKGVRHQNRVPFSYSNIFNIDQGLFVMDVVMIAGCSASSSFGPLSSLTYDGFAVTGTLRFLLLLHPLFMLEWYLKERKQQRRYHLI